MTEPSFVSWCESHRHYVPPYFPLVHYVRELPIVVGNLKPATQEDIALDLAPLSHEECARRGIKHSSEDDNSTALAPGDCHTLKLGLLRYSARKALGMVER